MSKKFNPKQKLWVEKFSATHETVQIISVRDASCNYRELTIRWREEISCPKVVGCESAGKGSVTYETFIDLTPSGIARQEITRIVNVIYPQCDLAFRNNRIETYTTHQPVLPISQLLVNVEPPRPKIRASLFKTRKKRSGDSLLKKKKRILQQELPITGFAAKLHEMRLLKGKLPETVQTILNEKVEHYSLEYRTVVQLPKWILELLDDCKATLDEREIAQGMYEVVGEQGALTYIEGIPSLRQHFGLSSPVIISISSQQTQRVKPNI